MASHAARALPLLVSAVLSFAPAASAQPDPRGDGIDEIVLRSDARVRGHVLQLEPGRFVVIVTEDGHRRMFTWESVAEVNVAPVIEQAKMHRDAASVGVVTYEARAQLTALTLPPEQYGAGGFCATGVGLAPVSNYGQTDAGRASAIGGGIGGRIGYMHIAVPDSDSTSPWWALRVSTGLDFDLLQARLTTGIPPADGSLCIQVQNHPGAVQYERECILLTQVPLQLGGHVGLGSFASATKWQGVVLGLAWTPTYTRVGPSIGDPSGHLNFLGAEFTVDFASLEAGGARRDPRPSIRVGLLVLPSIRESDPVVAKLTVGAVWY